jgi:iron complex outermembrane receptor protein
MPVSVLDTEFQDPQFFSDYYVENASFLRMDNITLGYSFTQINKVKMRVYATAQNLFVLSNYSGIDPEVLNGIDNNAYPRARTFVFGVNIGL